jgi:hypothetical protein
MQKHIKHLHYQMIEQQKKIVLIKEKFLEVQPHEQIK